MVKKGKKQRSLLAEAPAAGYSIRTLNWQAWLNIILLFVTLEIAVISIEKAQWISPQPSLTLTLVLSMLVTLLLARRRLPGVIIHSVLILTGLLITLWQAQNLLPAPDITSRLSQVITALQPWQAIDTAAAGTENLFFAVFLVLVTWISGYVSTWFLTRRRNAWVGVSLGALVILVNLSNLMDSYYFYLFFYFITAVFLIAHTRMIRQPNPVGYNRRGWAYTGVTLLCLTVLAGSLARFTPELRVPKLETTLAAHMLWTKNVEASRLNIFSSVPAKQAASTSGTHKEQAFEGDWHDSEAVNFIVTSARPSYWRVHVYDVYTAGAWENSAAIDYLLEQSVLWDETVTPSGPNSMTYRVSANLKTDIMLMSGSFVSADNPALVQVSAGDVISVRMPRVIRPGETYTITSSFFSPSPSDLARASQKYPQSITDYYLQLPPDFPDSVRKLSKNLTASAATPYEEVMAINKYLSKIPYKTDIKAPPKGADPVEYFIFTQKSGFCLYYASAMAVMLRSVGVPSRLSVGYLPGEPGEKAGEYVLKDKDYHAWPQVYFEGFGWVDVEATPGGSGSGVTIETPWISGEAIAQWPEWDVWLTYPLEPPDLPPGQAAAGAPAEKSYDTGAFFFADALGRALLIIFAGALILIILVTPVLAIKGSFIRWLWHVDRDSLASLAYDKMCNLAARVDLGPRPQQTPLEFASRLAAEFPEQAGAFYHVARSYVENTFGRRGRLGLFEEAELLKARCSAFGALLKRLSLAGILKRVRHQ